MFVDKLYMINFRKFTNLEVNINNRISVIVGKNGNGKTTILNAITYLLAECMGDFITENWKTVNLSNVRIKSENIGDIIDNQPVYPSFIRLFGSVNGKEYSIYQELKGIEVTSGISTDIFKELREKLIDNNSSTLLPVVCFYGADRLWHAEGINDLTQTTSVRQNGYINCLNAHLDSKSMNTWFEKMTYVELQKNTKLSTLQAVYSAIKKSFASITECKNIKLETNLISHELEISYTDLNENTHKFVMSQLSDGYRCTVSLIADIAYRMATLNPQLGDNVTEETEGIVLIDEVDLHLHPEWQQKILGVLTEVFPKVQFIVTTHAPAVINSVKKESLIILDGDNVVSPSTETYGRDMNFITNTIMGATERPKEVKDLFEQFRTNIDEMKYNEAREILTKLENILETDDPELAGCKVILDFEEDLEND